MNKRSEFFVVWNETFEKYTLYIIFCLGSLVFLCWYAYIMTLISRILAGPLFLLNTNEIYHAVLKLDQLL